MAISAKGIRRAISQNMHPAGKAGMWKIEAVYNYPNGVIRVTNPITYPRVNSVGLIPSQTIARESHGGKIYSVLHNHGNGTLNCVACLS